MYQVLGLGEEESNLYQFVLANSPVRREHILETFGDAADRLLLQLIDKRLTSGEDLVIACNPESVLSGNVLRAHKQYTTAKGALNDLIVQYHANLNNRVSMDNPVEVLTEPQAVKAAFATIRDTAVHELRAMYTHPFQFVTELVDEVVPHETQCKILVEARVFADPEARRDLQKSHNSGCEIRVTDEDLPTKLLAKDGELAIMPRDGETGAVLMIRPGLMLTVVLAAFDMRWDAAIPAGTYWVRTQEKVGRRKRRASNDLFDQEGVAILRMLVEGATDSMIVNTLGISQRTLTRRVAEFLALSGAKNRFQLGWIAANSDWMPKLKAS
ncbi:hypothetical protein [Streptosporangium saharense]|uniref:hypothetical protein n=1 Tax=Streptosporangium saharense TaxID=1706840 RepID=UPI00342DCAE0